MRSRRRRSRVAARLPAVTALLAAGALATATEPAQAGEKTSINRIMKVPATVCTVGGVIPAGATKVMISTRHDAAYPSAQQAVDGKIRIKATVVPAAENHFVYFRVYDPDDLSSYEANAVADDNDDPAHRRGSLAPAPGYATILGTKVLDGGDVIEVAVASKAGGVAEVDLTITDRYAGDNYQVAVDCVKNPTLTDPTSGNLVAWKRVYIEEDQMYKHGRDLTADFTADGNAADDVISVVNSLAFNVGDRIVIFDRADPEGQELRVVARDGGANTLTVDDWANNALDIALDYEAGYPTVRVAESQASVDDDAGFTLTDPGTNFTTKGVVVNDIVTIGDGTGATAGTYTVTAVAANTLTLNANPGDSNGTQDVRYSVTSAGGRGAAVARIADGFFDVDVLGRTPHAFGDTTDGADDDGGGPHNGGTFVEWVNLADGANKWPFRNEMETFAALDQYTLMWFKNRLKVNYIHVVAASHLNAGDNTFGISDRTINQSYVFVSEIDDFAPFNGFEAIVGSDSTAHELGHHFDLAQDDGAHPADAAHTGGDSCLMDTSAAHGRDRTDDITEFCSTGPAHVDEIRSEPDAL